MTLSFNLAPNVALGDAVSAVEVAQREMGLPPLIHASFQGTAQAFQSSLKNEPFLILAALVAVYIVLGMLYESYIHPITILSTLPSAGVGAIMALAALPDRLSVIAMIGIILLIGIVKKNAIMMIDFAIEAERKDGKSPEQAIYEACMLRFRPIMMTTMAALFGGLAAGSRYRNGIGTAPPAWHQHRGRADRQPAAYAVHHSGCLPLHGSAPRISARDQAPTGEAARGFAALHHVGCVARLREPRCGNPAGCRRSAEHPGH